MCDLSQPMDATTNVPDNEIEGDWKSWTRAMLLAEKGEANLLKKLFKELGSAKSEKEVMKTNNNGQTPLIIATLNNSDAAVEVLLEYVPEAQVMVTDVNGDTALMHAAGNGYIGLVELHLKHVPGMQVMACNKEGRTALHEAARYGHADIIPWLLLKLPMEQLTATDKEGKTALMTAREAGKKECVEALSAAEARFQAGPASSCLTRAPGATAVRVG